MSPDKKILKFFLLLILLFASVRLASAQTNFTLPTILPSTPAASGPDPVGFVSNLYQFGLMIGGLLAFGMIVYAGLRHTLAAGNPSSQSDARDQILQALLGLLLLFGAFIVLNTINPNLTNLSLPKLGGVEQTNNQTLPPQQNTSYKCGQYGISYKDLDSCSRACSATCVAIGGTTTGSTGTPGSGKLTSAQANQLISGNNNGIRKITVVGATSLEGIREQTLNAVVGLKSDCDCDIVITAGTETDHHTDGKFSHQKGYKVDLRPNSPLNREITENFIQIGTRSDGALQYRDPKGNIYAREENKDGTINHWDVLVKS